MKNSRRVLAAVAGFSLALAGCVAYAMALAPAQTRIQNEAAVITHARGTFDVKVMPAESEDKAEGNTLGRYSIDKQYHGDIEAAGKGEMLGANTSVKNSAGYVAMERVTGTLNGKTGSFVLQHTGTMSHGNQQLNITVVPDSGTGQLTGLTGKMNIEIKEGKHFYDFEYELKPAQQQPAGQKP
jgi:Protein of unknown function (DUF3224)